jgi:hypothetical protein
VVVAASLAVASCGGGPAPRVNSPSAKACIVDGRAAKCGTLMVPEDRLTG